MPKVSVGAAGPDTLIGDIAGVGTATFTTLGAAGYPIKRRTTLGEFREMTGSMAEVEKRLNDKDIGAAFVLTKIRSLWSGPGSGGTKRKEPATTREGELEGAEKKQALDGNFLLGPNQIPGTLPDGENKQEKDIVEVDALYDLPDPTQAVPTGYVNAQPEMSVIPDVTLNISPSDVTIAGQTEVLPGDPAPTIPGIGLGPSVPQARMLLPQTLDEKQAYLAAGEHDATFKADGEKDLGSDAGGSMTENSRVGINQPGPVGQPPKGVAMLQEMYAKGGPQKTDGEPPENGMVSGTRHPFKQPALFRNHDRRMGASKELVRAAAAQMSAMVAERNAFGIQLGDPSYYRTNAATQGVIAPFMAPEESNYLDRGPMVTSFQLLGPNALVDQWPPSPYEWGRMSGPFR